MSDFIANKTVELKDSLKGKNREEQLKLMKDYFHGQTCFLFSCGPSLSDFDKEYFMNNKGDAVIATVKQAFYPFAKDCSLSFFNLGNFTKMQSDKCIFFGSSNVGLKDSKGFVWGDQEVDVFDLISNHRNIESCVAATKDFEKLKFENVVNRSWGPGIMYETVFYNLIHLGFKKIYITGWDYSDPAKTTKHLRHFYNKKDNEVGGLSYFKNPTAPMFNEENAMIIESSDTLHDFLVSEGVEVELISDKSFISKKFKRTKIKDII